MGCRRPVLRWGTVRRRFCCYRFPAKSVLGRPDWCVRRPASIRLVLVRTGGRNAVAARNSAGCLLLCRRTCWRSGMCNSDVADSCARDSLPICSRAKEADWKRWLTPSCPASDQTVSLRAENLVAGFLGCCFWRDMAPPLHRQIARTDRWKVGRLCLACDGPGLLYGVIESQRALTCRTACSKLSLCDLFGLAVVDGPVSPWLLNKCL